MEITPYRVFVMCLESCIGSTGQCGPSTLETYLCVESSHDDYKSYDIGCGASHALHIYFFIFKSWSEGA